MRRVLILMGIWAIVALELMNVAGPEKGLWFFGGIGMGVLGSVLAAVFPKGEAR